MKKLFLIISFVVLATSCSSSVIDVKSPCVSNDDGPCGPKRSINDWWLKDSQTQHS